jgi:hypothetical protein
VRVYIDVCVCIHSYILASPYHRHCVCIYTYTCVYAYTRVCVYIHTYLRFHIIGTMSVCAAGMRVYTAVRHCVCVRVCTHTHIHSLTHVCVYITCIFFFAGELGYSVGMCYTSMSGFSEESHAGTVQTCALGVLLRAAGMQYWDLGMPMAYKAHLGATDVPRQRFLIILRAVRDARQRSLSTAPQPAAALLRPTLKLNHRVRRATIRSSPGDTGDGGERVGEEAGREEGTVIASEVRDGVFVRVRWDVGAGGGGGGGGGGHGVVSVERCEWVECVGMSDAQLEEIKVADAAKSKEGMRERGREKEK